MIIVGFLKCGCLCDLLDFERHVLRMFEVAGMCFSEFGDSHCDQPARCFPQHLGDDLQEFLGIQWWGEETGDFLQHRDPPMHFWGSS